MASSASPALIGGTRGEGGRAERGRLGTRDRQSHKGASIVEECHLQEEEEEEEDDEMAIRSIGKADMHKIQCMPKRRSGQTD